MPQHGPVPDFPLKNKIVLITGGGSGIGFAFSKLCHLKGARVLIGDLKLVPEAEEYVSQTPKSDVAFEYCDVTSWQSLHDLISASIRHFGAVPDVYAPVAGVFEPPWSNFWDDNEAESYKTLRINVDHPIKLTRLAMRALAGARKQGVVCVVASAAGIRANYFASLYSTSKHALVGFVKAMGQADVDEGVKINCVLPGMVQTPLWTDREDDVATEAKYDARPGIQADDVAEIMVRMVEGRQYGGGICVLKTFQEERIIEESYENSLREAEKYDPSPRPLPDMKRIREILEKERGKEWV